LELNEIKNLSAYSVSRKKETVSIFYMTVTNLQFLASNIADVLENC